jgi:hypothetical protein
MMDDQIFDLGVENESLGEKFGEVDEKWLGESKSRIKRSHNNERKNRFILERMKRQNTKIKSNINAMRTYIMYF